MNNNTLVEERQMKNAMGAEVKNSSERYAHIQEVKS